MKILLIEDNPADARLVKEMLIEAGISDLGYKCVEHLSEGLKCLSGEAFDAVLLDLGLPDSEGLDTFTRVHATIPKIPIIILTGLNDEEVALEAVSGGAQDYIVKGRVDGRQLMRTIRYASERKRAEVMLHASAQEWQTTFDAISDSICLLNMEGKILRCNKAMANFLGKPVNEIKGSTCWELIHGTSQPVEGCPIERMKATRQRETLILPAGDRVLQVSTDPVFDEEGSIATVVHIMSDITERKSLEEQLLQSQKMEAIGTLTSGIAHDFNNMLTAIIGNAELALMNVGEEGPLREEILEIRDAGEMAASLTRQLLGFSRKQAIRPRVLDLNELLTDIEKMLARIIGENVDLLTIYAPELWQVEIDPGQVEQVIMNLAINAKDAMPEGGKLTVETANVDLGDNYFREHAIEGRPGCYVVLSVSDTGSGMDKEIQEHIFEPFFTTKRRDKGTGLGLSTIYGIARQNKGFIWVYSEPGRGSTFKIYLPKVKEDARPEESERPVVYEPGGSETVLIVEDDDKLRSLARRVLQKYGYQILEAENGEAALRICKAQKGSIQLMITDVVMPGMNGRELATRIQSLRPEIKIIFMSGYTDEAIVHHGVLKPGLNFIEKPFRPEGLARMVRKVLEEKQG